MSLTKFVPSSAFPRTLVWIARHAQRQRYRRQPFLRPSRQEVTAHPRKFTPR